MRCIAKSGLKLTQIGRSSAIQTFEFCIIEVALLLMFALFVWFAFLHYIPERYFAVSSGDPATDMFWQGLFCCRATFFHRSWMIFLRRGVSGVALLSSPFPNATRVSQNLQCWVFCLFGTRLYQIFQDYIRLELGQAVSSFIAGEYFALNVASVCNMQCSNPRFCKL